MNLNIEKVDIMVHAGKNKYIKYKNKEDNKMNTNDLLSFDPMTILINMAEEKVKEIEEEWKQIEEEINEEEILLYNNHITNCLHYFPFKINKEQIHVYLAGKISENDWRVPIVGYRCGDLYAGEPVKDYTIEYNRHTIITGPWFLSCDHGCYHGDNTHGLGINKFGCPDSYGDHYTEHQVYNICLRQIDKSDMIFAYIDDNTCYGSIYEIAYARAMGKRIVIIFSDEKLMSNMWFMCQGADIVDLLEPDKSIKTKFNEILKTISVH